MERFREKGTAKGIFYAGKKPTKTWEANVDNIVISNLFKKKLILSIWLKKNLIKQKNQ